LCEQQQLNPKGYTQGTVGGAQESSNTELWADQQEDDKDATSLFIFQVFLSRPKK